MDIPEYSNKSTLTDEIIVDQATLCQYWASIINVERAQFSNVSLVPLIYQYKGKEISTHCQIVIPQVPIQLCYAYLVLIYLLSIDSKVNYAKECTTRRKEKCIQAWLRRSNLVQDHKKRTKTFLWLLIQPGRKGSCVVNRVRSSCDSQLISYNSDYGL